MAPQRATARRISNSACHSLTFAACLDSGFADALQKIQ